MKRTVPTSSEPAWFDPRNDRKTPYTDAELDRLTDDQTSMMADTAAWRDLDGAAGLPVNQAVWVSTCEALLNNIPGSLLADFGDECTDRRSPQQ